MHDIRIAAAQFEARDADKDYNFRRIEALASRAVSEGARIVSFHECCITGYTFLQELAREDLAALAEMVPEGPSTRRLIGLSQKLDAAILAGLIESEGGRLFNTYVAVSPEGFVSKHRKLHAFISPHLSPGDEFRVFELCGVRSGILTCYDNNLVENPRILALMGAEVIFAPHVTCGLESPMPGRGKIPRALWDNRQRDPVPLRMEFTGPKGRAWLMRWLPTRGTKTVSTMCSATTWEWTTTRSRPAERWLSIPTVRSSPSRPRWGTMSWWVSAPRRKSIFRAAVAISHRRPGLYEKLVQPLPRGQQPEVNPGWRMKSEASGAS